MMVDTSADLRSYFDMPYQCFCIHVSLALDSLAMKQTLRDDPLLGTSPNAIFFCSLDSTV